VSCNIGKIDIICRRLTYFARYKVSKLMELLLVRELANGVSKSDKNGQVVLCVVNPGAVATDLVRDPGAMLKLVTSIAKRVVMRSAEEGSRTLINGAGGAEETHGQYLNDCQVSQ
jgi:retinol dehydrogenase-12